MPEKLHKVILDTNLWVSFLLDRQRSLLAQVLLSGTIDIISSQALEDELFEVLSRPKFQHRFSDESRRLFHEEYSLSVQHVEVVSQVDICRDPKDNFLLALACDAEADFLLTGDSDLLVLQEYRGTLIVTIRDFVERYL
jgi:putative PIN family toxin of toxin-antitoxin system